MAEPYDRMVEYLEPGDYVKLSSKYGKGVYLFIESDEPLGQMTLQMTDDGVNLDPRDPRAGPGGVVPPFTFIDAEPVQMPFLEPYREDRLYQVRPTIFAVDRDEGILVDRDIIPPLVMLEWDFPDGNRMGGSDIQRSIVFNGIPNNNIGGIQGGRIAANMIYTRSDPSEVYDMFIFFKTFPAFRLINWTRGRVGGLGPEGLQWDWYLAFQGRKFIFRTATAEESQKLDMRELPFRGIPSPGGVPETLLRRD